MWLIWDVRVPSEPRLAPRSERKLRLSQARCHQVLELGPKLRAAAGGGFWAPWDLFFSGGAEREGGSCVLLVSLYGLIPVRFFSTVVLFKDLGF